MAGYYSWSSGTPTAPYNRLSPYLAGFQQWVMANFGGRSLGDYEHRKIDSSDRWSPHAFGAAWDWGAPSREAGLNFINRIISAPQLYGIQAIHDYQGGRIWHVGRGWKPYNFPPGDRNDTHFHFEVGRTAWSQNFAAPSGSARNPSTLTREETAQIAYQAGFRGQALINMVAIAGRESGYRPNAHRTDRNPDDMMGDRGLWQINYVHDKRLMQAGIIRSPRDLLDPIVNARAAFFLSGGGSPGGIRQLWQAGPGGWQRGGNPLYGTDVPAATEAVENARASGLLGQNWSPGGSYWGGDPGLPGGDAGVGPVELPRDAQLVRTNRGLFAVFNLGKGVFISYTVPGDGSIIFDRADVTRMSHEKYQERYGRPVNGGSAVELGVVTEEWGTYRSFFENVLIENIGMNNPARNDPGVRRVLARAAARPDMSDSEFRHRLEGTKWWKQRTQDQLLWNDLSPAEQRKRRQDAAVQMAQIWFQLVGEQSSMRDMLDSQWVDDIASGRITIGWWADRFVKPVAGKTPESPWARTIREEGENQRQRGIDIENTANQVRQTVNRWGLRWSNATVMQWAEDIMEKTRSDDDLIQALQEQATALYPLKQPEVETETYAQPWIQVFGRVMENEGTVFTPQIQKALQSGMTAWDFEQELKASPEWLATANGQESMDERIAGVGRLFGMIQ